MIQFESRIQLLDKFLVVTNDDVDVHEHHFVVQNDDVDVHEHHSGGKIPPCPGVLFRGKGP